jgi:SAM-dependent methyltransferase
MSPFSKKLKNRLKRLLGNQKKSAMEYHEKALSTLFNYVELNKKSVLIVGLGKGLEVPIFLSKGCASIDAVEPFPVVKGTEFGAQFQLHTAPAEQMPLQDASYDVVYTLASLEHMTDPYKAVQEMMRVLKPNGILFCSAGPFWYSPYGYHAKNKYPLLYDPWFHILHDDAQEYIETRKDIRDQQLYTKHIHNIYSSPGYNREKSQVYYDVVADLVRHHIPLSIRISIQPETLLNKATEGNSKIHQFDKRDLLTDGFELIFRKV